MRPQHENETHRLERAQRIAVKTIKCLQNAPRSEGFKDLHLFSLLERGLGNYFHIIWKCLYRNKNFVVGLFIR